jgi:predicted acyltransferase
MATPDPEIAPKRLLSLDALRGFDMFWIVGGSGFFIALVNVLGFPESWVEELTLQMEHVKWDGFHFLDLIFPLFVFISGVTIPYSILSQKAKGVPVRQLQIKILKRSAILILIGLSYSLFKFELDAIRLYTVLWLIGMSYLIGASLTLHVANWKHRLIIFFGVLILYHLALLYLPYPGKGPVITPDNNFAAWLDRNLIPTNLYRKVYDPEGTIRVLTGGMLCLLGAIVGQRIKHFKTAELRCGGELLSGGLLCLLWGWLWSLSFPIIKDLWSPSFILWTAGWSLLLLALFYTVLDVWGQKWLGWVFVPIGMNAITIYVSQWYLPLDDCRDFFFKGFSNLFTDPSAQKLVLSFGILFIQWIILYALYRKKIFLRI